MRVYTVGNEREPRGVGGRVTLSFESYFVIVDGSE